MGIIISEKAAFGKSFFGRNIENFILKYGQDVILYNIEIVKITAGTEKGRDTCDAGNVMGGQYERFGIFEIVSKGLSQCEGGIQ